MCAGARRRNPGSSGTNTVRVGSHLVNSTDVVLSVGVPEKGPAVAAVGPVTGPHRTVAQVHSLTLSEDNPVGVDEGVQKYAQKAVQEALKPHPKGTDPGKTAPRKKHGELDEL